MKASTGLLALGMSLVLGACASAPPATGAKPASPAAAAPAARTAAKQRETARLDPNETVCRRQQTTGSRFAETRCQTRYQWEVEARLARKQVEDNQKGAPPPTN